LETVPVTLRKAETEEEIDKIRIIENLVSRTVPPYEYALNIAHLIRIYQKNLDFTLGKTTSSLMTRLAERLKITPSPLSINYAISHLIPQLGQLLSELRQMRVSGSFSCVRMVENGRVKSLYC
jgi:hypothetical protein